MATKKIFLVDTENVGSTWKDLLPAKTGSDQILLFFTENSPYVSYSDLQLIMQYPDCFEMIKCNPGKNGLDFQLVSYLGYLIRTASKANYVIVSNDGGFDAVVKFWQDRGMSVSRMNVYHALQPAAAQVQETSPAPASSASASSVSASSASASAKQGNQKGKRGRPVGSGLKNATVHGGKTAQTRAVTEQEKTGEMAETKKEEGGVPSENAPQNSIGVADGDAAKTGIDVAMENGVAGNAGILDVDAPKVDTDTAAQDITRVDADTVAQDIAKVNADVTAQGVAKSNANTATQASAKADSGTLAQNSGKADSSALVQDIAKTATDASTHANTNADSNTKAQDITNVDADTAAQDIANVDANTVTQDIVTTDADTSAQDIENGNADASAQDIAKTDADTSADASAAATTKGKSGKTTKATTRKKAAAPSEDTAKAATAKAPAKRQKKASAAPLTQPVESAALDSENMELDFSGLTFSEKELLLRKYLPKEFSEDQESLDIISDIMFGHDTTNHHQLHLAFVKSFGDEKGTLIYKAFRPHLAEFRA